MCLLSCDKGKNIPDVSHIEPELEIIRFERELFNLDTTHLDVEWDSLQRKYSFAGFYLNFLLGYGALPREIRDTLPETRVLKGFLQHPYSHQLRDTVEAVYGDFSPWQEELEAGFRFYKYYFPELEVPTLYTFIGEHSYGVLFPPVEEEALMIGLDMFLGPDYEYYYGPPIQLPKYIVRSLTPKHLTSRVFEGLVDDIVGDTRGVKLIDKMINRGKKLYILRRLLPHKPDSILLKYTQEQLDWVENNEYQIWVHLIDEELLYIDDSEKIRRLVEPAPYSAGMPAESPGRAVNWIGWQIVESYMKRHPETTLPDLVRMRDAQELLDLSRYRPG